MKIKDTVRVKDPTRFISSFAAKIKDRDAIVIRMGGLSGRPSLVKVEFQKRNGRGKVFEEWLDQRDLIVVTEAA